MIMYFEKGIMKITGFVLYLTKIKVDRIKHRKKKLALNRGLMLLDKTQEKESVSWHRK